MNWQEFQNVFQDCELKGEKIVIKSNLFEVLKFIKNNYYYDMLKEIIAVDNKELGVELIYKLYSVKNEDTTLVSITTYNEMESVTKLYDSAVADEKEIYDLFGINFIGNNELKRLYMPETWKGHPLKKDYVEDDERLRWND